MESVDNITGINYNENPGAFYISSVIRDIFSEKDQDEYSKIVNLYNKCFILAKQNKIPESKKVYKRCCTSSEKLNSNLMNWILAFYGQRLCYYHYKLKNYEEGIVLTLQIKKCVQLLRENGYSYLFFVQIQQNLNLARIYFELDETEKAISICSESISEMYNKSTSFNSDKIINGISENELKEITEYGMIVEVLSETCNKTLFKFKQESKKLKRLINYFISPLKKVGFESLSTDPRYAGIDRFVSLMSGLAGATEIQDNDILFFLENKYADKKLLKVLNNYINLVGK